MSIRAWSRMPWEQVDGVWWPLARWQGATFPPQVLEHLSVEVLSGGNGAGQT